MEKTLDTPSHSAPQIDLNCDLGESYGPWKMGEDEAVIPFVSSISIACGFHAGDPHTMQRTVQRAVKANVAIGAHPSLPDRVGFGRREMKIAPSEVYADTLYQIGALSAFAVASGTWLNHVKPHGALYHMAERDPLIAEAIVRAVKDYDSTLILVGFSGGNLLKAGAAEGLQVAHEVFADRHYEANGQLTPRNIESSVIHDPQVAAAQLMHLLKEGSMPTRQGTRVMLKADTVCLHGDRPHAGAFAAAVREVLVAAGWHICSPERIT